MSLFAKRLKECRKLNGLSAEQLSEQIGYNHRTIYHWEDGTRECNFDTILKLAAVLDETPNYLLGWDEYPENPDNKKESKGQ